MRWDMGYQVDVFGPLLERHATGQANAERSDQFVSSTVFERQDRVAKDTVVLTPDDRPTLGWWVSETAKALPLRLTGRAAPARASAAREWNGH